MPIYLRADSCCGFITVIATWLQNILRFGTQLPEVNSCSLSDVASGEPQGSVLGPLLFLMYICDLPCNISSGMRLFADNFIICRAVKSPDDHICFQNDVNLIYS